MPLCVKEILAIIYFLDIPIVIWVDLMAGGKWMLRDGVVANIEPFG
jgi:hypothetical protein